MADPKGAKDMSAKDMSFDAVERAWLKQALLNQAKMLSRARTKEVAGGEIWTLRGKEIEIVNALAGRF